MKNKFFWILILLLAGCTVPPPPPPEISRPPVRARPFPKKNGPEIRIGVLNGIESADFSADRDFVLSKMDGTILAPGKSRERWKIQIQKSQPAGMVYRLVAATLSSGGKARKKAEEIESKGLGTVIDPFSAALETQTIERQRWFRVYLKPEFKTYDEAKAFQNSIQDRLDTFLSAEIQSKSEGSVEFLNLGTGERWTTDQSVRIKGANVTLYGVPAGTGFHWEHAEDMAYPEVIEFNFNSEGRMAVVNVVSLEQYIKGVVPSEMHPGFPMEALKAQAIAVRSRVYNRLGRNGHEADPFDLCDEVHCQVYSGLSRHTPITDLAVEQTAGRVLWYSGEICDAVFCGVCGGHGENADKAWGKGTVDYLKGNYDGSGLRHYGRLSNEKDARKWIDSSPASCCNTIQKSYPRAFEYTQKYFRWQTRIDRYELEAGLLQNDYPPIGTIRDLIPEERGISGRIIRLRVIGSEGAIDLQGELKIRKALSPQTLWSSCFYIEKTLSPDGILSGFVLKGAGWGHGVGMCQTGAAGMALAGKRCDQILRQYFRGARIKNLY